MKVVKESNVEDEDDVCEFCDCEPCICLDEELEEEEEDEDELEDDEDV